MPSKKINKLRRSFEFQYTVTTEGIPQPHPVPPRDPKILVRFSLAENENGSEFPVLNICGNPEGLEYLAAMLVLSADSAKYDPEFHIHLEHAKGVEADIDVAIRAPAYFDVLHKGEFREFKGAPMSLPKPDNRAGSRSKKSQLASKLKRSIRRKS